MNKSESIIELAKALAKAQGEMKNPPFDSKNPHFRNSYASLASVRDTVTPVLAKHGLSVSQLLEASDRGVKCETILLHESGEWISSVLELPAAKQDAQSYGSAATYCRRYALQAICNVVGDADDDANTASAPEARQAYTREHPSYKKFREAAEKGEAALQELVAKATTQATNDIYAHFREELRNIARQADMRAAA
jgi:hypothetical protein